MQTKTIVNSFVLKGKDFLSQYTKQKRNTAERNEQLIQDLFSQTRYKIEFINLLNYIRDKLNTEKDCYVLMRYLNFSLLPIECERGQIHVLSFILGLNTMNNSLRMYSLAIILNNIIILNKVLSNVLKITHVNNVLCVERVWLPRDHKLKYNSWTLNPNNKAT